MCGESWVAEIFGKVGGIGECLEKLTIFYIFQHFYKHPLSSLPFSNYLYNLCQFIYFCLMFYLSIAPISYIQGVRGNVYYFIVYVFYQSHYRFSVDDTIDRLELMDCLSVIMSVYFSFYLSVSLSLPLLLSLYYKLVTRLKRLWRLMFYLF